ncbi:MAG: hypothetical protein QXW47_09090 [Candidatus Jordarchaeales archaeon]|nr:hypothetical protein [Candidatus Jordarchaeia archaeon]
MLSKRRVVGLLVFLLVLALVAPCAVFTSGPVSAQPVRHTYTFPNADGSGVNFNVTVDTGILIEGGIGSWSLMMTASPAPTAGVNSLMLRGTSNGSVVSRGFLVPARDAFLSDKAFNSTLIGFSPIYVSELLVVWQDTAGLPVSFSFDLVVTVTYSNGSVKDVHLKSDEAVSSFIMPNPGELPPEARNFMVACYLSSFLLPLVVVSINKLVKKKFSGRVHG